MKPEKPMPQKNVPTRKRRAFRENKRRLLKYLLNARLDFWGISAGLINIALSNLAG